jgi:hypothetical protein
MTSKADCLFLSEHLRKNFNSEESIINLWCLMMLLCSSNKDNRNQFVLNFTLSSFQDVKMQLIDSDDLAMEKSSTFKIDSGILSLSLCNYEAIISFLYTSRSFSCHRRTSFGAVSKIRNQENFYSTLMSGTVGVVQTCNGVSLSSLIETVEGFNDVALTVRVNGLRIVPTVDRVRTAFMNVLSKSIFEDASVLILKTCFFRKFLLPPFGADDASCRTLEEEIRQCKVFAFFAPLRAMTWCVIVVNMKKKEIVVETVDQMYLDYWSIISLKNALRVGLSNIMNLVCSDFF